MQACIRAVGNNSWHRVLVNVPSAPVEFAELTRRHHNRHQYISPYHTCVKKDPTTHALTRSNVRSSTCVNLQRIHGSTILCEKQNTKWPKATLEALKRQQKHDHLLLGPVVKSKKHTKNQQSKKKISKKLHTTNDSKNNSIHSIMATTSFKKLPDAEDEKDGQDFESDITESSMGNVDSVLLFPLFRRGSDQFATSTLDQIVDLQIPNVTDSMRMPSVTNILKETMPPESKFFLDRWKKQMIAELGVEGFAKYQKEVFANGSNLHACIQQLLENRQSEVKVLEANAGHWQSLQPILSEVEAVEKCEGEVTHPHLHYKGIFDCVAEFRGNLCVIDWKTSKRQKADIKYTYDNPLQLAAYAGALNFDSQYKLKVSHCLLVIAYEDGSPADIHEMDTTKSLHYWGSWLHRLHQYWRMQLATNSCGVSH